MARRFLTGRAAIVRATDLRIAHDVDNTMTATTKDRSGLPRYLDQRCIKPEAIGEHQHASFTITYIKPYA
ncbi:hypothetical protein SE18_23735 [Herpetosiphon geysericola]|uniref:Uncharacterized protein n=1 Tax=Herpetosiphon geysericola TaxID=70996 RepID=A0A0P6XVJ8_9CHLR|nr:hypothetical protein SE18_23735 [Herpetosiphon geysericola]